MQTGKNGQVHKAVILSKITFLASNFLMQKCLQYVGKVSDGFSKSSGKVRARIFLSFATTFANLIFFVCQFLWIGPFIATFFPNRILKSSDESNFLQSRHVRFWRKKINDNSVWTVQKLTLILGLTALWKRRESYYITLLFLPMLITDS